MVFRILLTLLIVSLSGAVHAQTDTRRNHYIDVYEYFTTDAQYEAWFTLTAQLNHDFDDICGDTFCEGDYSNIESLRFRCSVEQTTGRVGRCLWIFAGSSFSQRGIHSLTFMPRISPLQVRTLASAAVAVFKRAWNFE